MFSRAHFLPLPVSQETDKTLPLFPSSWNTMKMKKGSRISKDSFLPFSGSGSCKHSEYFATFHRENERKTEGMQETTQDKNRRREDFSSRVKTHKKQLAKRTACCMCSNRSSRSPAKKESNSLFPTKEYHWKTQGKWKEDIIMVERKRERKKKEGKREIQGNPKKIFLVLVTKKRKQEKG